MSTSSKPKSRAAAHQNRTAFRHNKNSKLTRKIAETATTYGLCDKCSDKVVWRMKYRKYKALTQPKTCNRCGQRTIKAAYRSICGGCAGGAGVCAGCGGDGKNVNSNERPSKTEVQEEENTVKELMRGMTERQRRTAVRRVERGEDEVDVITKIMGGDVDSENEEENEEEKFQGGQAGTEIKSKSMTDVKRDVG